MASEVNYRKSKFSSGSDGNCIEVGNDAEHVFIRDTRQRHMSDGERTTLAVSPDAFRAFVKRIQASLSIADRVHARVTPHAQLSVEADPLVLSVLKS
jgi:hypothetical protein